MSVNGTGLDRRTNKPANDTTTWTVREPHDPSPVTYRSGKETKEAKGMKAADAFALVRQFRALGRVHVVAVRT